MRKITLFLALMLYFIGASAQTVVTAIDTEKSYTLECRSGYAHNTARFIGLNDNGVVNGQSSTATYINFEAANTENGYYIKIGEKYLNHNGSNISATTEKTTIWTLGVPTHTAGVVTFTIGNDKYLNNNGSDCQDGTCTGLKANTHSGGPGAGNACSLWQMCEYDLANSVNVTYEYYLNGEKKDEAVVTQQIGSEYNAPAIDYASFTYPEGNVTSTTTTVRVDCTQKLPFTLSESYDDATWYFMTIRSNSEKYVARSETAPYTNSATITTNDNGLWAFMGNVFDGIRVINKAAGNGQTLGFDATSTAANIYMKDGETSWIIQEGNGGFLLRQAEDYAIVHDYGSKLQFWNDARAAADPGSAFKVYSAEETLKELQQEWLKEWKEDALTTFGYVGGYPATMAEAINAVSTYAEALAFDADNAAAKIALVPGNYYRIQNVFRERMIGVNAGQRYPTTIGKTDVSQIWTFEAGENGQYYIKNLNGGNNGYMKAPDGGNDLTNVDAATLYTLTELGGAQYLLEIDGRNLVDYGIKNGVENGLGGWSDNGKGSDGAWYIIPATELEVALTAVESASYATGFYPFPVSASSNTTLNVGTLNADKSRMTITAVNGIPANTGVIIVNSATEAATTLTIGGEYAAASNNALTGSCTAITEDISNYLVLGIGANSGVLGFYKTTAEAIPANKAFLEAGSLNAVKLDFGGEATAIENVELSRDNAPVFDLSGRRVLTPVKGGVYIQNGKKFIVK